MTPAETNEWINALLSKLSADEEAQAQFCEVFDVSADALAKLIATRGLGDVAVGLAGAELEKVNRAMGVEVRATRPHYDPIRGAFVIPTITPTEARARAARRRG